MAVNQQSPHSVSHVLLTFALAGTLTACGGGGGGSSDSPLSSSTPITITDDNAKQVAGMAAEVNDAQSNGVQRSQTALAASAQSNSTIALESLARSRARQVATTLASDSVNETINCTSGGTLTIALSLTANQATGKVDYSGTMSMADCSWDNLYRTSASLANNGSVDINASTLSLDMSGSMNVTEIATAETLNITNLISATNFANSTYTTAQAYTAGGSMIGNKSFVLTTPTPISGSITGDMNSYPTSGTYRIDGASGNYLTMSMDSSGSGVNVAVNGGSGTFVSWSELEAQVLSEGF